MNNEKRFKILVAGCGAIAVRWMDYTIQRDDCEIVGLVEINPDNAEKMKQKYNLECNIYNDINAALKETDANLVYDLTYVTTHKDIVTTALKAGCDVFGEKPMTLSLEDAREMLETAESCGRTYAVMQNRRYHKGLRALKEVIDSGHIGKPGLICADIFVFADTKSIRNLLEKPMLQDNAVHTFDQARFLVNADAVTAYCHSFNPVGSKYNGDAAGICTFEMSDGSVFSYRCWMGCEGLYTSWESSWRIMGSKGTVVWDGFTMPYYESADHKNENGEYIRMEATTSWDGKLQHAGCLEDMFSSLIEGHKPGTDCTDNIKSIGMVFASIESAIKSEKVDVKY